MNHRGQVLVFVLVLVPLLILVAGVIVRSGMTAYVHSRVQKFLDKKALDALATEARGLEALGKMNPHAMAIIDARRKVDVEIIAAAGTPAVVPLIALRNILLSSQQVTAQAQAQIKTDSVTQTLKTLTAKPPLFYSAKTKVEFTPHIPLGPHFSKDSLLLHVNPMVNYFGEVGAPLEIDSDFHKNQNIKISADVKTESYLPKWAGFRSLSNMKVFSAAIIKMEKLEDPWTVKLEKAEGNLSWN